ncbi:MarR family transcriptional regulator [Periweissella cryptocerci]|uniref:MarR family transcriptional regulator n=1 Tax=Periweissella cryptocerci TaxID=2506420 RepID=A0A4P6YTF1_9LACO|nr:MarR family transcriptional regulator [Periweissella cryptocerci]QBO35927.1 MarR family transcriptional regulator [Periweissella cryptocerci]
MVEYSFVDRPTNERINATRDKFPEANGADVTLFLNVQWTYRAMQKQYDALLDRFGLTETKFIILMFLHNEPTHQLMPSILAQKLGSTRVTTTKVINGLERNGWVTKAASARDKRAVIVALTDDGESLLQKFLPANYRAATMIMSTLNESEQATLASLLDKVKQGTLNLQNEMEKNSNEYK